MHATLPLLLILCVVALGDVSVNLAGHWKLSPGDSSCVGVPSSVELFQMGGDQGQLIIYDNTTQEAFSTIITGSKFSVSFINELSSIVSCYAQATSESIATTCFGQNVLCWASYDLSSPCLDLGAQATVQGVWQLASQNGTCPFPSVLGVLQCGTDVRLLSNEVDGPAVMGTMSADGNLNFVVQGISCEGSITSSSSSAVELSGQCNHLCRGFTFKRIATEL